MGFGISWGLGGTVRPSNIGGIDIMDDTILHGFCIGISSIVKFHSRALKTLSGLGGGWDVLEESAADFTP